MNAPQLGVHGECVYCDRTVDGWLGAMLGRHPRRRPADLLRLRHPVAEHLCIICDRPSDEPIHSGCAEYFTPPDAMAEAIVQVTSCQRCLLAM